MSSASSRNQALDYDDLLLYWHAMMQDERARGARSARASTTCWSTSTRTPTCCRREILQRAASPTAQGVTRRRRRRAGDLFVPRRDGREHPRISRSASTPPAQRRHARGQLPLDAADPRRRERADRRRHAAVSKKLRTTSGGAQAALRHGGRRPGAGALRRRRACSQRASSGVAAAAPGGAVPQLASQRRARARAASGATFPT